MNSVKPNCEVGTSNICNGLVLNVPAMFNDPDFREWLNNGKTKFTWHKLGSKPSEWSDVVVLVDPSYNGEGADSDMPEHCWDTILEACKVAIPHPVKGHVMVRLTNIE